MSDPLSARILVVDDEPALMKALCDTLQDHGYETVGVTKGKAALAALGDANFDLLLTDLMMPEMDGIALLRSAQEIDSNLFGIMMTGAGTIAAAVEAMRAGALDYILKPFELRVILPVLSRALAMRRLHMENAELERRVRKHAVEVEAMNKELEAYSYTVSHDLRAPVRAIGSFSQVLLDECEARLSRQEQQILRRISNSAQQMGQMIEALLNMSRLGRQALKNRHVNLSVLAQEVLEELLKEEGERRIELIVGNLPDCVGDASLLRWVFVNLLSNAFKYTRQKEKAVVEVGCREQAEERVYFVRDNGAGFDMKYAKKLFGVFQRLHRTDEFEGTGVGLSIVQRIIQRHDGRIWAEAEVNKGATFYFTLQES